MVTCFSEHAVRISETSCPSYTNLNNNNNNHIITPSVPNAVVCLYKTTPIPCSSSSTQKKPFLITVIWCRNQLGQGGLTINFGDNYNNNHHDPSIISFKINTFSRLFRKKKGHKSLELLINNDYFSSLKVDVFWDLSSATYDHSGPEPIDGFYILVTVDSVLGLALGDLAHEAAHKRLKMGPGPGPLRPKWALVSRREHYSGSALYYSTKAQFCDSGVTHDIMIRCSEDHDKVMKQPVLYVSIDKRTVMKIKRLQWNFRGNQTVFVDGLLVDLMWDVHDWFSNNNTGCGHGVFMFKTRSGSESRLWLEEKLERKDDQDRGDFSLMIYATKNNP